MNGALVLFLAVVIAGITFAAALALLVRSRLRRRHRIHPKVRTDAPVTWLADPRAPARLHRRLAKVGRTAGAVADDHRVVRRVRKVRRRTPDQPPLVAMAEQLQARAVRLDAELARVAMLPKPARQQPLGRLRFEVGDLELACLKLVNVSAQLRTPAVLAGEDPGITDVAAQVERIARAHEELLRIDEAQGLVPDPTVVQRPEAAPTQVMGRAAG